MSKEIRLIQEYLELGGLFNPEMMEHDKVRDLLINCREEMTRMRNALSEIAGDPTDFTHTGDGHAKCRQLASAAIKCERCDILNASRYRQDTKFCNEADNWVTLCRKCRKANDEHWRDMWADFHSGCL